MALTSLIFDVDGTLADTEREGHRVAFNKAFAEAGLDWVWDVALYGELLTVTGGKERIQFFLDRHRTDFSRPRDMMGFLKSLHMAKTRFYVEMLEGGEIPLRPGVERLLRQARAAGLRLAIATTTTPENVTALLRATLGEESIGWFEVIAAGDIVPAKKPAPDIYQYALRQMGVDPAEALAFEDSDNGLKSARGAGLRTVVTVNDYTRAQDFTGAMVVLDQLGDEQQACRVVSGTVSTPRTVTVEWLRAVAG